MRLAATLDNKRLNALLVEVFDELGQRALMSQHHTFGIGTVPVADRQLWMFTYVGGVTHKDGIFLSTQLVREHLRLFVTDLQGFAVIIDKTVGRLCPLEDDIRTMLGMIGEETAIQPLTLLL